MCSPELHENQYIHVPQVETRLIPTIHKYILSLMHALGLFLFFENNNPLNVSMYNQEGKRQL